jgi:hypothetical protein
VPALEEVARAAHEQIAAVLAAELPAVQEADAARGHLELPGELRVAERRAGQHEQARQRLLGRVGDVRRRPADLLEAEVPVGRERLRRRRIGLDRLELRDPRCRAHDLHPAGVHPGLDAVELAERVVAVLLLPQVTGPRVEREAERVAQAVGEQPLDVRADFAGHRAAGPEERVVARSGAVVVEPHDHARPVGVVGLRPAELVVGDAGAERPVDQVLQLAAATRVTDDRIELAVGPEAQHAPVVVASQRLIRVRLERAELQDAAVELERLAVPLETVDPVAHQPHAVECVGVGSRPALAPEQVDEAVAAELRMQGDAEQPSLRSRVHGKVEHHSLHLTVDDALDPAGGLLQHQHVVLADEGQGDRLVEARDRLARLEVGVDQLRLLPRRRARERQGSRHPERKRSPDRSRTTSHCGTSLLWWTSVPGGYASLLDLAAPRAGRRSAT